MLVLTSRLNFIDRGADQKKGKRQMPAFRKDYGNLATLRSLCKAEDTKKHRAEDKIKKSKKKEKSKNKAKPQGKTKTRKSGVF